MSLTGAYRILDASLNRAAEGLRVVEDYVRFVLDDGHLTELAKQLRHDLATVAQQCAGIERFTARDTPHDVGTAITTPSEHQRPDAWAVCQASFERAKQSLRSLEEFSKVAAPSQAAAFESLRYRLYTLEAAIGRTVDAVDRLGHVTLCVLIDGRASEEELAALVAELIAAGVGMIQLRDKRLPVRQLVERARILCGLVRKPPALPEDSSQPLSSTHARPPAEPGAFMPEHRPLVIINDRPAVAAAVNADGVHLGQDDFTVKDARAVIGPRKFIGVSTHSIEQARQAVLDGANYIGVGPTFPSPTKAFEDFPGTELLRQVAREFCLPAFAIGGIDETNLNDVLATGISRVAVSSAVAAAPSPAAAASALLRRLATQAAAAKSDA